jgi:serine/threonine protein kinase
LNPATLQQQFKVFTSTPPKKVSWLDKEFTRISVLGRGHFGQVLKCQNKTDQFEYAIKVTNNRIRNPNEQEFYLQEM